MKYFDDEYSDHDSTSELEHAVLLPREVMNYLACGRNTFFKLVHTGALPAFRVGKQWRVLREDLIQFSHQM